MSPKPDVSADSRIEEYILSSKGEAGSVGTIQTIVKELGISDHRFRKWLQRARESGRLTTDHGQWNQITAYHLDGVTIPACADPKSHADLKHKISPQEFLRRLRESGEHFGRNSPCYREEK